MLGQLADDVQGPPSLPFRMDSSDRRAHWPVLSFRWAASGHNGQIVVTVNIKKGITQPPSLNQAAAAVAAAHGQTSHNEPDGRKNGWTPLFLPKMLIQDHVSLLDLGSSNMWAQMPLEKREGVA